MIILAIDKGVYAWADAANVSPILSATAAVPLYQPFTIKRFLTRYTSYKPQPTMGVADSKSDILKYPLSPLSTGPLSGSSMYYGLSSTAFAPCF